MSAPSSPANHPGSGPSPGLAFCYRHPLRETAIRCVRCDRPICNDCMRPASVGFQCPDDVRAGRVVTRTVVGAPAPATRALRGGWRSVPPVTGTLLLLNVAVFLVAAAQSVHGLVDVRPSELFREWTLVPYFAAHGSIVGGSAEPYRLLTATFLHVGLVHVVLNMIGLLVIGMPVERLLGWWRFGSVYLLGALGSSLAVFLFEDPLVGVAGASGAIYGLMATAVVFVKQLSADIRVLGGVIALNVAVSFSFPSISWLSHLGGFAVGGLAALCIWLPRGLRGSTRVAMQVGGLVGLLAIVVAAVVLRAPHV